MKRLLLLCAACLCLITSTSAQLLWGVTADVASSSFGNDHPRVAMDASGNPMVIWKLADDVLFAKWNGTGFNMPDTLNPGTINVVGVGWYGPELAAHGDTVYVVYQEAPISSSSSHVWCQHSFDGGVTFSAPVQVDNIGTNLSDFPTITTDASGNPLIAFMKYDSGFGNAEWVVVKSTDFGSSFSMDTIASGWSSPTTEACDCCPGELVVSNNTVAMMYRDNNSNIRDNWVGISNNGGVSFSGGMNIDQQNWNITSCPSAGGDGFIIGDTLYSTFMNGASGKYRVYANKTSISSMSSSGGNLLTGTLPFLSSQNYPRIANYGNAAALIWKQNRMSNNELPLLFTNDITNGFPASWDTVALSNVLNADVAMSGNKVFVLWQDYISGTIKYRWGDYSGTTGVANTSRKKIQEIYPNPTSGQLILDSQLMPVRELSIVSMTGKKVKTIAPETNIINVEDLSTGIYFIRIDSNQGIIIKKFVKE